MTIKKQNKLSAAGRYKIQDKYPNKAFSKSDKQRIAAQIVRQLNMQKTSD